LGSEIALTAQDNMACPKFILRFQIRDSEEEFETEKDSLGSGFFKK
jgi:hypothetical protein